MTQNFLTVTALYFLYLKKYDYLKNSSTNITVNRYRLTVIFGGILLFKINLCVK